MSAPRPPVVGVTTWTFLCSFEDADLVRARLARFRYVDVDRCFYADGRMSIRVDLALLPHGDGPALRLAMERDLQTVIARHRLPTDRPGPLVSE